MARHTDSHANKKRKLSPILEDEADKYATNPFDVDEEHWSEAAWKEQNEGKAAENDQGNVQSGWIGADTGGPNHGDQGELPLRFDPWLPEELQDPVPDPSVPDKKGEFWDKLYTDPDF